MICIILCFALGIANIFHFDIIIVWSVILLYAACLSLPTFFPCTNNLQCLRLHSNLH